MKTTRFFSTAAVLAALMFATPVYAQYAEAAALALELFMKHNAKVKADGVKRGEKADEINTIFATWEVYQQDYFKVNGKGGDCAQIKITLPGTEKEKPINYGKTDNFSYECGIENNSAFIKAINKNDNGDCPKNSVFKVKFDAKTGTFFDVSPTKAGCKSKMPYFKSVKLPYNMFNDLRDMQTYRKVKIGNTVWMAEDLNYRKEGKSVCVTEVFDKDIGIETKYCRYIWEKAKEICPDGWKLPSSNDLLFLKNAVGTNSGTKLKAKKGWGKAGNVGNGTDNYGFAALPVPVGLFSKGYERGYWWTDTDDSYDGSVKDKNRGKSGYAYTIRSDSPEIKMESIQKENLLSVRCIEK